jgi:2,4-dienoyl-CoA reductase (NADPH2)
MRSILFEPVTINGVTFRNRLVRSSIGGRTAYYDGRVSDAWKAFERRFAEHGVGAIVSATITIDDDRWSPLEYPKLTRPEHIGPIREGVRAVQALGCRYILQLGDPGYHTQTSLFHERVDHRSSSGGFDLLYGYGNRRSAMTVQEIEATIRRFAEGARRVREIGCDGLEVTASKGYLIHQFLNPAINRRPDAYGGSAENRFTFLEEVVRAIRNEVGRDFLFGIRLSANDYNYLPYVSIFSRWPPVWLSRRSWFGNRLSHTIAYARRLRDLGVDYLHVSNGFGFINPKENPGDFPVEAVRMFANSTRHLSGKAAFRAALLNLLCLLRLQWLLELGWKKTPGVNLADAAELKRAVGLPVIANGGLQKRSLIDAALNSGGCDLVSLARPLLANPHLPELFRDGREEPENPCTFCNRCAVLTTILPLGCYDRSRFGSQEEMERQIVEWNSPDADP